MRSEDQKDVQQAIGELIDGKMNNPHIKLLFIHLRFQLETSQIIKEIGDFIVHDNKDRGTTFILAKAFIGEITKFDKNGGTLSAIPLIITQEKLADELIKSLSFLHLLPIVKQKIKKNSYNLMKSIIEILSDSSFKISHPFVINCRLLSGIDYKGIFKLYLKAFPANQRLNTILGVESVGTEILRAVPPGKKDDKMPMLELHPPGIYMWKLKTENPT